MNPLRVPGVGCWGGGTAAPGLLKSRTAQASCFPPAFYQPYIAIWDVEDLDPSMKLGNREAMSSLLGRPRTADGAAHRVMGIGMSLR